jgi:hypothetical protein
MHAKKFDLPKTLTLLALAYTATFFSIANVAEAAAILRCDPPKPKQQCHARLEDGAAGSPIEVLDEKAHLVARGWIVKRSGAYGIVAFTQILKPVERGYPVIIKPGSIGNNLQWTASFSDKD